MKLKEQGGAKLASWGGSRYWFKLRRLSSGASGKKSGASREERGGAPAWWPPLFCSHPPTLQPSNLLSSSAAGKPASASLCSRPAPNCTCDFLGLRQRWCQGFPLSGRQGSAKSTCPAPPAACPATQPSNPLTHPPVVRCAALHTHPVSRAAAAWKMTAAVWLS